MQILNWVALLFLSVDTTNASESPVVHQLNSNHFERLSVNATIHPNLPEFSFRLVALTSEPSDRFFSVNAIEIRHSDNPEIAQLIEGFEAEIPRSGAATDIEILDMNFDGYDDLRVIEFIAAGPNVPYLNWLFNPGSGQFEESVELNAIVSPQFDAKAGRIESQSRDGANRYRTDRYEFVGAKPVLISTEIKEYLQPGEYQRTVTERVDGSWQIVEQELVQE